MNTPGMHSHHEITTQGRAWDCALEQVLAQRDELTTLLEAVRDEGIVFIGCGSMHCLALFAAAYVQEQTGIACRAAPASELWLNTAAVVPQGRQPLVVALSRSGETSETISAVGAARTLGCRALAITCYDDTALAAVADRAVVIAEGREESLAQTRSFAGTAVAVQTLAALAAGDAALLGELQRLPSLADELIARADGPAQRFGADLGIERISYLGSGALYGLAAEAHIKAKEMSLSIVEPFHFMEFRHGPLSLVDSRHLVVALLSERMRRYEVGVLRDVARLGGRVLAVANDRRDLDAFGDDVYTLDAPLSERARPVLYLPVVQLLAYHRAFARGLDPDRPRNVVMSVRLDGADMAD